MNKIVVLFVTVLSGCVSHIPMKEQSPDLSYFSSEEILISVIDQRWRVSEGKSETEFGVMRSMGIPFSTKTYPMYVDKEHEGQSLAGALEDRIIFGLSDEGWKVERSNITAIPDDSEISKLLLSSQSDKLLLLILKDWWVDFNVNWVSAFKFDWDTTIKIYGKNGDLIQSISDSGRDIVDEDGSDSWQNMFRRAFRARIIKLFEDPNVVSALNK